MIHNIVRQKAKHKNWKFEDVGLKCRFYQMLESMLDAAPGTTTGPQEHGRRWGY